MEKIAFDLDDVLFQTSKAFREESLIRFGFDCIASCNTYDMNPEGRISQEDFNRFIDDVAIKYWDWVQPYAYVNEVLTFLYGATGKPIIVLTSRNELLKEVTHKMLDKHLSVPYEVIFSKDKRQDCLKHNFGILVDDRFKTIEDCAPILKKAFIPTRPWNRGRNIKLNNVYRIRTLKDILCLI